MTESYKKKYAKELLVEWLYPPGDDLDYDCSINDLEFTLNWRSNRIFIDYPLVLNEEFNSIDFVWDEHYKYKEDSIIDKAKKCTPSPSKNWCIKKDLAPELILDVAISHKGLILYGIVIVENGSSPNQNDEIYETILNKGAFRNFSILEISADWVLNQVSKPKVLKVERYKTYNEDIISNEMSPHGRGELSKSPKNRPYRSRHIKKRNG